jgi:hypothetical protein
MAGSQKQGGNGRAMRHLGNPLDFIAVDNARERDICNLIDGFVASGVSRDADLAPVLTYLKEELPLHILDENEDFLPVLRKRCQAVDQIGKVIDRLQADHSHAITDLPAVIDLLQSDPSFSEKARTKIRDFVFHARRHISVESAILLPIARVRLKAPDLERMRRNMLARRGLDQVVGLWDA